MSNKSKTLFTKAKKLMPGGVNSPVRAFGAVGGTPRFVKRAKGTYLWDADGKRYFDFCGSWGPMILGHAYPKVVRAIQKQAAQGTSYGTSTENEIVLAELIQEAFPSMEKLRLVSSGTEAVMSAIRLARGFTKRSKILKCSGCYHGHGDSLLVKAGSGGATFGIPNSAGVPDELAQLTLTVPYNDLKALEQMLEKEGKEIAVFILEPVPANIGVLLPKHGYLEEVRQLTQKHGVLLLFDEVITGFRLAFGGAQASFNIKPDLTTLGKIIGGGLPIGVFGGRAEIMAHLAPDGAVYQAGTLSGNPLATAAGIATLRELKHPHFYQKLHQKSMSFFGELDTWIKKRGAPIQLNRIGSLFTIFFTESAVFDEASAKTANTQSYSQFFHHLLEADIYFAPSQFEANFVSQAMTAEQLRKIAAVILKILTRLLV